MDKVDEYWACTLLGSPSHVKIAVRFIQPTRCVNRNNLSNKPTVNLLFRRLNNWVVSPVVPNKDWNAYVFSFFDEQ